MYANDGRVLINCKITFISTSYYVILTSYASLTVHVPLAVVRHDEAYCGENNTAYRAYGAARCKRNFSFK